MHVEIPRLVKKPGPPVEYKRVETQFELDEALAHGWLLRLAPAAPYEPPSQGVVASEPKGVELPRLLKKTDGQRKRVNTQEELDDALAEGWLLRLPVPVASEQDAATVEVVEGGPDLHNPQAQEPIVESPADPGPDEDDDEEGEDVEQAPDKPVKRKPGRPAKVRE